MTKNNEPILFFISMLLEGENFQNTYEITNEIFYNPLKEHDFAVGVVYD